MSNSSTTNKCPKCYNNEIRYWKDEPINPEIKPHLDEYILPVKEFHLTLHDAMKAWGEELTPEEIEFYVSENKRLGFIK